MNSKVIEPIVSIVRLDNYEAANVDAALVELLKPLGGAIPFFKGHTTALLKPNLLAPKTGEQACCTHLEIIRGAARMARQGGVSHVEVCDSPGFGSAERNMRKMGAVKDEPFAIYEANDGIEVAPTKDLETKFHRLRLSSRMVQSECIVNLAKAKTHGQMVITGAVKNMYGAVVGLEKAQWHFRAGRDEHKFARLIVHIHELVKPRLNIVDGVYGMEGNGPGSGTPRKWGLLFASTNAYALDYILADLWGLGAEQVHVLAAAKQLGLLPEKRDIKVVGPSLDELRPNPRWQMARPVPSLFLAKRPRMAKMVDSLLRVKPVTNQKQCTACGRCVPACAAEAITIDKDRRQKGRAMIIDYDRCVTCFCCQEICPEGAIGVHAGLGARMLRIGTKSK